MASRKKKRTKSRARYSTEEPPESRTSVAVTVCWTVTLTTLFFLNLAASTAHFYVVANPPAQRMAMLRELLLVAGALVGCMSLALLPPVYRFRQTLPPRGLVAFGACLALAPILAVVLRAIQ
jgi:hypothetical protein